MTQIRRLIDPSDFAGLISGAQLRRSRGMSKIHACRSACIEHNISDDWAVPLLSVLNDSRASAEAWAERIFSEAAARAEALLKRDGFLKGHNS